MTKWDIKRGDIIMCDLGDRDGSVQRGVRPCVVVSNDYGNTYSNIYIVVPLTSKHKTEIPTHVEIAKNSYALCEQVTTISDVQVFRKKGFVDTSIQNKINMALKIAMNL